MRRLPLLLVILVAIVGVNVDSPRAAGPSVAFHAIGDLPGGAAMTVVRDATWANGVLYAVGSAVRRFTGPCPCPNNTDTAILWRWNGTTATLEPLPDLVANNVAINNLIAFDITADAAYIASQSRVNTTSGATQAVRVTTNGPFGPLTNLNLAASPFPVLAPTTFASAISDDGTVLYGTSAGRVIRFDTSTSSIGLIPTLLPTHTGTFLIPKGISSDGNVAVGSSFGGSDPTRPIRYTHSTGTVAQIPFLPGGTSGASQAVSPDGDLVLMTGNSPGNPNAVAYLYRHSTGAVQPLGTPQAAWQPGGVLCANGVCSQHPLQAGMTADGSVVVMNFRQPNSPASSEAYFRNQYGWFLLTSALGANGLDISAAGWKNLLIMGISSDGTLVYGAGEHNGVIEGFVADFKDAVKPLAGFNPLPSAPADTSIVGAWTDDLNDPGFVLVFTDQGVYYHIESTQPGFGFERGLYTFDGSSITFTTLVDTNGTIGASGANGSIIPFTVNGNQSTLGTGPDADVAFRIVGSPGSFAGAWVSGIPTQRDSSFVGVAIANTLFQANDDLFGPGDDASKDSYTYTSSACPALLPAGLDCYALDITNDAGNVAGITPDGLMAIVLDDDGHSINELRRVIDPARIPVIGATPLAANAVVGQPFTLDVNASLPVTFTATGLPNGLSIMGNTGVISGTPTVGGQFVVTVRAVSDEGVADVEPLTLTVAIPTPVGPNVTVEPVVSEGQGDITLTFDEVTTGGQTTVEAVSLDDLADEGVPPPGNVDVGGVIYNVETTASFTGLVELCFSYQGIDFGGAEPRLFHYENNAWVDITVEPVDTVNQIICGTTTSLSPFAILKSNIVRKGFYAPVNPIAGFLNTVKAGSTVPLKFEVFVGGVEKTTTAGIELPTTHVISCEADAPEDPVETSTALAGAGLRYDTAAGYFIVNWKAPTAKGCYLVQVKTTQDQLALTARFKTK